MDEQKLVEELYQTYRNALYYYAESIVGDEHKAADIVQSVFTRLLQRQSNLKDYAENQLQVYLMICVRGESFKSFRQKEVSIRDESLHAMMDAADAAKSAEELSFNLQDRQEVYYHVQKAMKYLPEHYKDILYMRYNLDFSYREIAQIMSITEGNARQLTMRARTLLRHSIVGDNHE